MNKQNQELRPLKQISREDLQNIIGRDELTLDKFEVLGNSAMYSNNESIDQYKELLKVINFTKIADMIYLITSYGIVSTEQIEEAAEDEKRLADLLARRSYTEKYLQAYNLQDVDFSLDEMNLDLSRRREETKRYIIAAKMLLDELRRIELKIDDTLENLYFTDEEGERRRISNLSISRFEDFLEIATYTSKIFEYQLNFTARDQKKFIASLLKDKRFRTNESQDIED